MTDQPLIYLAGEFWPFVDATNAPPGTGMDIWALLQHGIERARDILVAADVSEGDLLAGIGRDRFPRGSLQDIAMDLYASAKSARAALSRSAPSAQIALIGMRQMERVRARVPQVFTPDSFQPESGHGSWAPEHDVEAEWIRATDERWRQLAASAAISCADFAMKYTIMLSMAGGLTTTAVAGRKASAQRLKAAQRGGEVSRNKDWLNDAQQIWAENPTWATDRVAKTIAARRSTERRHVDNRSVARSIKHLAPPSSPSFRG